MPELAPEDGGIALYKHRYSGFFETELDETLRSWGFRNLVFTGCTTSVCVESTIKERNVCDYHCLDQKAASNVVIHVAAAAVQAAAIAATWR